MAINMGQNGEMAFVLKVRDDGSAVIEKFGATTEKSAKQSSKAFDDFSSGAGISFRSVATYAGIAAAAVVAGGILMVKASIDQADALNKLAGRLGSTTEALSALVYAGERAGVSQDELAQSITHMARVVSDAAQNIGDGVYAIKDLGLNAQKLAQSKPEAAIAAIADALAKIPNAYDRARIEQDMFGRGSAQLDNMLRGGSGSLRAASAEAEKYGRIVGTDAAKAASELKDKIALLNVQMQGTANGIMRDVVPWLLRMTTEMNEGIRIAGGFWMALSVFGAISPFKDMAGNLQTVRAELERIASNKLLPSEQKNGTEGYRKRLEMQKEFLLFQQREAALALNAGGDQGREGMNRTTVTDATAKAAHAPNSRQAEEMAKQVLEIHRASIDDQLKLAEKFVEDDQFLRKARAAGAIKTEEDLNARQLELAAQYETDLYTLQASAEPDSKLSDTLANEKTQREAALMGRLASLQDGLLTEQELEQANYDRQIATLYDANQTLIQIDEDGSTAKLLSDEQFKQKREQVEIAHQAKLGNAAAQGALARAKYEKMSSVEKTDFILNDMIRMTAGVATHNKAMFEINKMATIAEIILSTPKAVQKAYESYPPPWSFVMGGLQLAASINNLNQARGATFGGSTSAPSIGGGGSMMVNAATDLGAPAGQPPLLPSASSQQATTVQINIQGNVLGNEEFVRETLIPALRAEINGRDIVFINSNSRQARELATT